LHPGANWPHKQWLPERFAAVGNTLARQRQARLVITGGPGDDTLARDIQRGLSVPALLLAGETTWRELAACLSLAQLIITHDTGVLHAAAALQRPVVALFGPTSPALTGPLGAPERTMVLHHPDCCPTIPCYQPDHPRYPGMAAITVEEVLAAAIRLLTP
jgi:ADP-heptose:LPS heptosyltransferase